MKTIVIADSRGTGLQDLIKTTKNTGEVSVIVSRGAGSELAAIRAIPVIKSFKPNLVILHTGICDLTWRDRNTKQTYLRHNNIESNVSQVMTAYNTAYELITSLENTRVSIATLTGLDLVDYNNKDRSGMDYEEYRRYETEGKEMDPNQKTLDNSIVCINRKITEKNSKHGVPTTWLAGVVHAYYRKTTHHYYRRLRDGCHPDKNTNKAWAKQVEKTIRRVTADRK